MYGWDKIKHGRPTKKDQRHIRDTLKEYFEKGISANATAAKTETNIKTVLKYFKVWEEEMITSEDGFVERAKITKEKTIRSLDDEIITSYDHEDEIDAMKNIAVSTGNILHFEKISKLKMKILDHRLKLIAAKTNIINTPTADVILKMESQNG